MNENGLSPETIREIERYILERLPTVLEQDPNFARWIEGLLAEKFPRRDELARMLDAIEEQRRESRQQMERLDERVERVEQGVERVDQRVERVEQDVTAHRIETRQEFSKVNERFEQVDQRFEQVDQRFEQVDQRFDKVDQRFDQADQRTDDLEARMEAGFQELRNAIWETHKAIDRLGGRWGIRNELVFRQTVRELLEGSFNAHVEERHIQGEQFDCIITNGHHILIEIAASVGPKIVERLKRKRQLYMDETGITPHRFLLAVGSIHSRRAEQVRAAGFELIEPELEEE